MADKNIGMYEELFINPKQIENEDIYPYAFKAAPEEAAVASIRCWMPRLCVTGGFHRGCELTRYLA